MCSACYQKRDRHFLPIPLFYVFSECFRQYRIILSADTASEVRQLPERCLSRKAGIVRCCLYISGVTITAP